MKYKMGDIEVEGSPTEIAEFLDIGRKAPKKEATAVLKVKTPKAKAVKAVKKASTSVDYSKFFGGKKLKHVMRELDGNSPQHTMSRPTGDIIESLHRIGLPRKKALVDRVKQNIWVWKGEIKRGR